MRLVLLPANSCRTANQPLAGSPALAVDNNFRALRLLPSILLLLMTCLGCAHKDLPGYYEGESTRYWEAKAASADPADRRSAAKALGAIGARGVPSLVKLFQDPDHSVGGAACLELVRIGPKSVPHIAELLNDPDPDMRVGAARALTFLGPKASKAAPALKDAADNDGDQRVRKAAAAALTMVSAKSHRALPFSPK